MATGVDGRWEPGIGDPTLGGWITVAAYFGAAFLAFRALRVHSSLARSGVSADERSLANFWLLTSVLLLSLGINKQLDLQSWFTQIGRDVSVAQGWYGQRRSVQAVFVAALGMMGLVGTAALAISLRRVLARLAGALTGLSFLVTFIAIRAASFHHIDQWLKSGIVRLNWVLELGGIALVALSAWRQYRHRT